jgi:hypothetical protein
MGSTCNATGRQASESITHRLQSLFSIVVLFTVDFIDHVIAQLFGPQGGSFYTID